MQKYGINDNESKLLCRRFLNENQEEILKPYTNRNSNSSNGEYEEDGEDGEDVGGGLGGTTQSQIANLLIRFAEDNATLFKDEFGVPHALLEIDNHHEVLYVEGKKFEKYLAKLFYQQIGTVATPEGLNSSVRSLSAKAIFDGETIPLHLRLAWTNPQVKDSIYYDLSDKNRKMYNNHKR